MASHGDTSARAGGSRMRSATDARRRSVARRSIPLMIAMAGCCAALPLAAHAQGQDARACADGGCRTTAVSLWQSGPGLVPLAAPSTSRASQAPLEAIGGDAGALGASRESERRTGSGVNGSAFVTALMSAVLPGAGQVRNGSYLRGFAYFAAEVTGWVAYSSFRRGSHDKEGELDQFADGYWSYDRYHRRAPDPDSCGVYECGCGLWTASRDEEIAQIIADGNASRLREYVSRDAYACGWDSPVSRDVYLGIWDDSEDLHSAQSWSGRLIFLNHLVSAVDAFLGARAVRVQLDSATQVRLDVRGLPFRARPEVRITRRF